MAIFLADGTGAVALLEYYSNPGSLIDSSATVGKAILLAECLAGLFFGLSLSYMFVNTWIKEGHRGVFIKPEEIKRLLIIMLLIPAIPLLMSFFQILGNASARFFELDAGDKFAAINSLYEKMSEGPEEEFSLWSITMGMLYKMLAMLCMLVSILFMYMIKFIILLFSGVFIQYCYVVAPLAMAFSMLPMFKDQVEKLLSIYINACFVGLTMNILDTMFFDTLFAKIITSLNDASGDIFNYTMIASTCFTIVIFYLMAFWLTAKYVGSPGAAAVMSMATTVTTVAAAGIMKAASAAASSGTSAAAGSGGGGVAGNIAKGATDSFKKD